MAEMARPLVPVQSRGWNAAVKKNPEPNRHTATKMVRSTEFPESVEELPTSSTIEAPKRIPKRPLEPEGSMEVASIVPASMMLGSPGAGVDPSKLMELDAAADESTVGKENYLLIGQGVLSLALTSPLCLDSPVSSKSGSARSSKRPRHEFLTPVNMNPAGGLTSSSNKTLTGYASGDKPDTGMSDAVEERSPSGIPFRETPFLHWNSVPRRTGIPPELLQEQADSESAVTKLALDKSSDPRLIADFSDYYILPYIQHGKHSDLKEISGKTLVALLNGEFKSEVNSFQIVDCRFPYEYNGGHIKGAINLYTDQQVANQFLNGKTPLPLDSASAAKDRNIIIFHCEFSAQRGPGMCRHLRGWDRNFNISSFPSLHYPEMYVLNKGYKGFFENHKSYCEPQHYTTMLDEAHIEDYKFYQVKMKQERASGMSAGGNKKISKKLSQKQVVQLGRALSFD